MEHAQPAGKIHENLDDDISIVSLPNEVNDEPIESSFENTQPNNVSGKRLIIIKTHVD